MISLESLERGTPEFQSLTPEQQNQRRALLSLMLGIIINQSLSLDITPKQATESAYELLEFHLTGKIEKIREEKLPQKRKKML